MDTPTTTTRCTVPPKGWRCSRVPGHAGPCAAHPTGWRRLQLWVQLRLGR